MVQTLQTLKNQSETIKRQNIKSLTPSLPPRITSKQKKYLISYSIWTSSALVLAVLSNCILDPIIMRSLDNHKVSQSNESKIIAFSNNIVTKEMYLVVKNSDETVRQVPMRLESKYFYSVNSFKLLQLAALPENKARSKKLVSLAKQYQELAIQAP